MTSSENMWTLLTTEVWLSPGDTDSNRITRLCVHGDSSAEAKVFALHITRTGFLNASIIVSGGVNLGRAQHMSLWEKSPRPPAQAGSSEQSGATLLWQSLKVLSLRISHFLTAQALQYGFESHGKL
jgi:hypothetical protein